MTDVTLTSKGLRLAASVHGPHDAPALLMLHGLSMSRDTWEEAAAPLAGRWQVWTLDFRGHGHSQHAPEYAFDDYVADARAALSAIGRPAVVVGHSLGGLVAGVLAQDADPAVRAVFLEDPPWYFSEPSEAERSGFIPIFEMTAAWQAKVQASGAPLELYFARMTTMPVPMGGVASEHFSERHLLSHASALQRQDPRCWGGEPADVRALLAGPAIVTARPLRCPVTVIQADARCGAALLDGHEARFSAANPHARMLRYGGCGHHPHRSLKYEARFREDLGTFLEGCLDRS